MRKVLSFKLLILAFLIKAQEKPSEGQITVSDTVKQWSIQGQNTLMLNQAAFSHGVAGGVNNIGWIAGTNYNMTY